MAFNLKSHMHPEATFRAPGSVADFLVPEDQATEVSPPGPVNFRPGIADFIFGLGIVILCISSLALSLAW